MRLSAWSSDVCSSAREDPQPIALLDALQPVLAYGFVDFLQKHVVAVLRAQRQSTLHHIPLAPHDIGWPAASLATAPENAKRFTCARRRPSPGVDLILCRE